MMVVPCHSSHLGSPEEQLETHSPPDAVGLRTWPPTAPRNLLSGVLPNDGCRDRQEWPWWKPRSGGLRPVGAAVLVAVVLTEEGADAVAAEIGDAVVAGPGEDHRVG